MNTHLSDDQLLDRLYGVAQEDAHLAACGECRARLNELGEKRAAMVSQEPMSTEFLAAQRRRIYARLEKQPQAQWKWVPALAAAAMLAIAVFAYRPVAAPPPALHTDTADAQLFSDVYSMEQSTEPLAAAPIHALFEDNQ